MVNICLQCLCYNLNFSFRSDTLEKTDWTKVELQVESSGTNVNARFQLSTTTKGVIWLDQVSVMPLDTYKVHIPFFFKGLYSLKYLLKHVSIQMASEIYIVSTASTDTLVCLDILLFMRKL